MEIIIPLLEGSFKLSSKSCLPSRARMVPKLGSYDFHVGRMWFIGRARMVTRSGEYDSRVGKKGCFEAFDGGLDADRAPLGRG